MMKWRDGGSTPSDGCGALWPPGQATRDQWPPGRYHASDERSDGRLDDDGANAIRSSDGDAKERGDRNRTPVTSLQRPPQAAS